MDSNNITNILQQGFRTLIGATAEAIETIQNTEKRNQTLSQLTTELQKKSQQWQEKGTLTEEEAKKIIEKLFQHQNHRSTTNDNFTQEIEVKTADNPYQNIQQLTQDIISLRQELEKMNTQVKK